MFLPDPSGRYPWAPIGPSLLLSLYFAVSSSAECASLPPFLSFQSLSPFSDPSAWLSLTFCLSRSHPLLFCFVILYLFMTLLFPIDVCKIDLSSKSLYSFKKLEMDGIWCFAHKHGQTLQENIHWIRFYFIVDFFLWNKYFLGPPRKLEFGFEVVAVGIPGSRWATLEDNTSLLCVYSYSRPVS